MPDKKTGDFFIGKSEHVVSLFDHFVKQFNAIGKITLHPTKTMIAFTAVHKMAYVTRIGKDFIDICFPFDQPYNDNLCFHKIAQVPGTQQFNHYFRMCSADDVNEEVISFMKRAYDKA